MEAETEEWKLVDYLSATDDETREHNFSSGKLKDYFHISAK